MLSEVLNRVSQGLIAVSESDLVLYFNDAANAVSSDIFNEQLVIGLEIPEVRRRTSAGSIKYLLSMSRTGGEEVRAFMETQNKYGTDLYFEIVAAPFKTERRDLTNVLLLMITDVTENKVFEHKLLSQAEYIRTLFETANTMIFGLDMRGYVTQWNRQAANITGYSRDEVYARRVREFLFDDESLGLFECYLQRILDGESVPGLEISIRSRDQKIHHLLASVTPRLSTNKVPIDVTIIGQDITELTNYRSSLETMVKLRTRELQRALTKEQEALEIRSRFVSIASHEFRVPLNSIAHTGSVLTKNVEFMAADDVRNHLNDITRNANHMSVLLDDVLDYGKKDQAKIKLVKTEVNFNEFLESIFEDVRRSAANTHKIEATLPSLEFKLSIDTKLMRSIVTNLLSNAIKFSPDKEKVYVEVRLELGQLSLSVKDDGIGIPMEEQSQIFEPFTRGKEAMEISGTGLGLSIVKKSVELMEGTLLLESEPGKGSCFTVVIPFQPIHV
ncbi:MAG: PAS domain-containing sensor histidine kinase [Bacteroidetes bacterium]|nr:PAS domain-containing sensor histidine kinase [Bacteroidota bacterium]